MEQDPAVTHGSGVVDQHGPSRQMNLNEKQIFDYLIHPDDMYTEEGVYWADLPLAKRVKFVSRNEGLEARRELRSIGRMTKADPLSPVGYYFKNMVLPGAGLGLEGCVTMTLRVRDHVMRLMVPHSYVLFSIGNLKPLFEKAFPACWKKTQICNPTWIASVEYLEICGIIVGQILVGIVGDW